MDDLAIRARSYASTLTDIQLCRIVVFLRNAGYMPAAELHDTLTTVALHNSHPGAFLASMPELRANNYFEAYFAEIEARGGLHDLCRTTRQKYGLKQLVRQPKRAIWQRKLAFRLSPAAPHIALGFMTGVLLMFVLSQVFGLF